MCSKDKLVTKWIQTTELQGPSLRNTGVHMREPTFTAPSETGWTSFVFKCSLDNHTKCLHNRRTDHDHVPVLCGVQIVTITPYIQVIRHSHGYCMYLTN